MVFCSTLLQLKEQKHRIEFFQVPERGEKVIVLQNSEQKSMAVNIIINLSRIKLAIRINYVMILVFNTALVWNN